MITVFTSQLLCFLLGSTYVIGLYMIPADIKGAGYDNKIYVRYRIAVTTLSNLICVVLFAYSYDQLSSGTALSGVSFSRAMGVRSDTALVSVYYTSALMCLFYLGPITSYLLYSIKRCYCNINSVGVELDADDRESITQNLHGSDKGKGKGKGKGSLLNLFPIFFEDFRNNVHLSLMFPETSAKVLIFAPISEELIFRAGVAMLLACSSSRQDYNPWSTARWCPLWFGVPHLHHAYNQWKDRTQDLNDASSTVHAEKKREIMKTILKTSCFQFAYTSIFGYIAALLYLRSGNLLSPITSHVICNWIQLPNMSFLTPPGAGNSASTYSCLYKSRWVLVAAHVGGLILFSYFLLPLSGMISLRGEGEGGGDRGGSPLWR